MFMWLMNEKPVTVKENAVIVPIEYINLKNGAYTDIALKVLTQDAKIGYFLSYGNLIEVTT